MNRPKRVALYARVSTDEQDEGMQLTALRELVSHRGWELVAPNTWITVSLAERLGPSWRT